LTCVGQLAKEEGVHDREWACTHGEDVTQNATYSGGGALVGLNGGGVIVALNTNGHGDPVTSVDHPGVLTRSDQDVVTLSGQSAQVKSRRLIGAVLGPHDAKER
jgi:hypothetical protein